MQRFRYYLMRSIFGLLFLTPILAQAQLLNGSFELPGMSGASGFGIGRQQYTAASQGLTNWTLEGPGDVFLHKTPDIGNDPNLPNSTYNFAQDGEFYLDLSGSNLNGAHATVSQDFASTPFTTYVLSFYIGASNETSPTPTINVQLTGAGSLLNETLTPLAPITNIRWSQQTFTFVANSVSTRLSFRDLSSTDDNSSYVDNVTVVPQAVPEPSSFAVLILGLAAVFLRKRQTRR